MPDSAVDARPEDVLHFWFEELEPASWWRKDEGLDQRIRQRFAALHAAASAAELWGWRESAEGRLAEVIVLDQFSRNLFREDARAFAQDAMALALAQEAVRLGADRALAPTQRSFLSVSYTHLTLPTIYSV